MAYGSVAELRARTNKIGVADDAVLTALIAAAQRNINRACHRPDGFETAAASARQFSGSGEPFQMIDECTSITLVEVKVGTAYVAWVATDWVACSGENLRPNFNRIPYDMIITDVNGQYSIFTPGNGQPNVRVTARWGYSDTAPDDIREACLMQAARWFKRYQSEMSDALAGGELGMLLYTQSLDPDVKRLLIDGRYSRPVL